MLMRHLARNHVLMEKDGGDGGGGGGGDGKGGGDIPQNVQDFVAKAVNGAMTNWSKRLEAKIPSEEKLIEKLTGSLAATLEEKLKGITGGNPGDGKGNDGKGGSDPKGGELPDAVKQAIARMESENAQLKKRLNDKDEETKKEREQRQRDEERVALDGALRGLGIPEARVKGAASFLFHDSKKIKRNEAGEICFEVKRDYGMELIPVSQGVTEWAATEEGKAYLPPAGTSGSGTTGGGTPRKPGEKVTTGEAYATVGRALMGGGIG